MYRSLQVIVAAVALTSWAIAQNATGTLDGRVTDASNAAVPNANVTVENQATNVHWTQVTNAEGRFYQRYLQPGTYRVSVEKPGFQKYIQSNILLDVEQTVTLPIGLKLGDVSTTVQVEASAAQLSTETSTLTTTVSSNAILDLPLNGNRSPMSLVTLVPGVIPSGGSNSPWISGGRNDYNDVTIDGTSVIVPENNVSHLQIGYVPNEDSVQEMSIVTNSLAPEYGRTGGGTINIATRSGTNVYHGSLFEYFQNNVLNANSWGNNRNGLPRGIVRYNQFGGTFGGPINIPKVYNGSNKTFFFLSEQSVRTPSAVTDTGSVPTDAMRQGIFTGMTNGAGGGLGSPINIYDPATAGPNAACPSAQPNCYRQPFPNNVVPTNRFDPVAVKLMHYWPEPNCASCITNPALQTGNWKTQGVANNPYNQIDSRVDQYFSEKFRMFGRFSNQTGNSTDFNGYGNPGTSAGSGPVNFYNRNATVNAIYNFTPTMIFNVNYGFARDSSYRFPFSEGTTPSSLGFPSIINSVVDNFEFPQIGASGNTSGYNLGQSSYTTLKDVPYSHILRADLTKVLNKHTLKMGGTVEKLFVNFTQYGSPDGQYSFGSAFTQQNTSLGTSTVQGNGFATFLLGLPSNNGNDIQYSFSAATSSWYAGGYFQDDWKVSNKLTLNLGVRYDVDVPRTERYNRLSYFNINAPSPLQGLVASSAVCPNCGNLKGAMEFVGTPGAAYGRHQTPTDMNNWAPRVGFAYHPFNNTVIRGAYGILYAPSMLQAAGTSGTSGTEGFTGGTALNSTLDNGQSFIASLSNPFPSGLIRPLGPQQGPISGTLTDIGGTVQDSYFNDYVNPMIQQWNFTVQQQVKTSWLLQAGYLGSKGQHLPDGESSTAYNQLPASDLALGNSLLARVPNPFYGIIQNPTSIYASPQIQANYLLSAYPQYQGVNAFRKPMANSNYQSGIFSVQHRYKSGLTMLASYTISKLLDDASQVVTYIGQAGSKQDSYCRKCEKSVSSQDVPQRFVVSTTYELPVGRHRTYFSTMPKAADFLFGGWQMNGIMTFQKGIPIAIANGGNTTGLNSPGIRPTDNGQNPARGGLIGSRLNEYFVQSDFSQTPNFAFGNVGRFLPNVRGPGVHNLDFSLFKGFQATERLNFQFRAAAFNLTNSPTWAGPGNNVAAPATFGIVTSANGNRTVQLALKMTF
ncbi:MAG: carboxypeptidase regulatory-like domain-containing protein [Candidatus Sulfopaludibacter sp.]|nr:carboxypeptidase regulatory-like domain-containing protein [Candidatus Sulfopaludibacter sp.]